MKTRMIIAAFFLLALSGVSPAQDALTQSPTEGIRIGPISLEETVQGVPLALQASTFLAVKEGDGDGRSLLSVRVVVDLSEFQSKIAPIIDTIPLPNDNCGHDGIDNLVARIWGKEISNNGEVATLRLNGQVVAWTCISIFGAKIKTKTVSQSFEARIPFWLKAAGQQAVAAELGQPVIDLEGGLSDVSEEILKLVGVDINRHAKDILDRAIKPDLLTVSIPAQLRSFSPVLTQAQFFSNAGTLAASFEMTAVVDGRSLIELFKMTSEDRRPQSR
jgi:hypothetical protein